MADRIITVTDPSIVTNDTLSGYNNYSDIDGQLGTTMTPTEATNGHTVALSDGVVHEVTTKPVGTTNGEFASVVSNAVTVDLSGGGDTLLLDNDFSANFDGVIEQTGSRVTSLEGGAMRMTITADATTMLQYIDLDGLGLVAGDSVKVLVDWKDYVSAATQGIKAYYPFSGTLLSPPLDIVGTTGSSTGDVQPPTVGTEYTFDYIDATNFGLSAANTGNVTGNYYEIDRLQIFKL